MSVYERMIVILKNHCKDDSLVFARALDKIGLAASMKSSRQNLDWALLALREALHLRLSHLGPHHLDTIDTLNNIAGVYLRMREWSHAKECYVDVLTGVFVWFLFVSISGIILMLFLEPCLLAKFVQLYLG